MKVRYIIKLYNKAPFRGTTPAEKHEKNQLTYTDGKVWFRSGWTMRDPKVHLAGGLEAGDVVMGGQGIGGDISI